MGRRTLRNVGIVFWIVAAIGAFVFLRSPGDSDADASLSRYFLRSNALVIAEEPSMRLRANDPVFYLSDDGDWDQIGYVIDRSATQQSAVEIAWHSSDVAATECRLVMYENDGRLQSVIATMLPPEKRQVIQKRLATVMSQHGDELAAAFAPLVQQTLESSLPVIETEIQNSIDRHRDEIDSLAIRWNDEVVRERLIPLARTEILPILREHGEPTATAIGRELWDNASIWRFGWRVAYDKSPLPARNLAQQEWDRFVEEKAIPIFEKHMDEVVVSVQRIVRDIAANDAVRKELAQVAGEIAADPETRKLIQVILKESLIENDELRSVWSEIWQSDEARQALDLASDRLEPVVRQIGDDLFGSQKKGINPDFARVLRNQILGKDRRWIVASRSQQVSQPKIERASELMVYPIVHVAGGKR
jgi:hypothetical protein